MLHAKYLSSSPYGSGEEDFQSFYYISQCKTNKPHGWANMTPGGQDLNKLGRGPLGNATCKISQL